MIISHVVELQVSSGWVNSDVPVCDEVPLVWSDVGVDEAEDDASDFQRGRRGCIGSVVG